MNFCAKLDKKSWNTGGVILSYSPYMSKNSYSYDENSYDEHTQAVRKGSSDRNLSPSRPGRNMSHNVEKLHMSSSDKEPRGTLAGFLRN